MREELALPILPPFIAENGHTQAATLTTNYQTAISAQHGPSFFALKLFLYFTHRTFPTF